MTLACITYVTASIAAEPIKSQHFKNFNNYDVLHGITFIVMTEKCKMANPMVSTVVTEVGTEVAQFMGYTITLNLNRNK